MRQPKELQLRRFSYLIDRPRLFWFAVCLLVFSLYVVLSHPAETTGDDASTYWLLAKLFTQNGHLSLLTYVEPLRGYSFPLLLNGFQHLGYVIHHDGLQLYRLFAAAEWAFLLAVILPTFFERFLGVRLSLASIGLFCGLSFTFWHGHMLYSLTDFFSLFLMASGVLFLSYATSTDMPTRIRVWSSFGAGMCLAVAANARPVNQITLVFAALFLLWNLAKNRKTPRAYASFSIFMIGAILMLSPQSIINRHNLHQLSPFANNGHRAGSPGLYAEQLDRGVYMKRYETLIDPTTHAAIPVSFLDYHGMRIRHQNPDLSNPPKILTLAQYSTLVVHHPRFFAGVYARHLFNGLDTAYSTPYPTRIYPRSVWLGILNFLILALALLRISVALRQSHGRLDMRRASIVAIFLLPSLIAIPTSVEARFLIPISMLLLGMVLFRPATLATGDRMFPRARYTVPVIAIVMLVSFLTATSTFRHIAEVPHATTWCVVSC